MFLPACIIAIGMFIFTGKPHDPEAEARRQAAAAEEARTIEWDRARTSQGR